MKVLSSLQQSFRNVPNQTRMGISERPSLIMFCLTSFCFLVAVPLLPIDVCIAKVQVATETSKTDNPAEESLNRSFSRQEVEELRGGADKLISQLGSDRYATRESALEQLIVIGPLIKDILEDQATQKHDPETMFRIRKVLSRLEKPNLTILDAIGAPIPFAKVQVVIVGVKSSNVPDQPPEGGKLLPKVVNERIEFESFSDATGGVIVPSFESGNVEVTVEAGNYGRGLISYSIPNSPRQFRLPLIPADSEAAKRALTGTIKDSDANPIAGATVKAVSVRTPGEGLINRLHLQRTLLLSNFDGSFRLYMPCAPSKKRGELIPINSNYNVTVSMPSDSKNVPIGGVYNNTKPANLVFSLDNRTHRFAFETLDGKSPTDHQLKTQYSVTYRGEDGRQPPSPVDLVAAKEGISLAPGTYTSWVFIDGNTVNLKKIELKKSSPEVLRFKFPPSINYRGRVIDCSTGKPIKNALVYGYSASCDGNLADLTDEQWDSIAGMTPQEILQSPFMEELEKINQIEGLTVSDDKGRFSLQPNKGEEYYGVIACAPHHVPYSISNYYYLPKDAKPSPVTGKINSRLMDFRLVPAATVLVNLTSEKRVSVAPNWVLQDGEQPEWIENYHEAAKHKNGKFEAKGWLPLNKPCRFFVPADIKLNIQLRTPYDEYTALYSHPDTVRLKPSEELDLGKVEFQNALTVVLRVVDEAGNPVEGLPVRAMHHDLRRWTIAHTTDQNGEARFGLNPNSSGQFRVSDLGRHDRKKSILKSFEVADASPAEPLVLKLSQTQIEEARKASTPRGGQP